MFVVVARARQDPEVKKEKLDLPERKETRAGLVDLDYRDPRVHRYTNIHLLTHGTALSSFQRIGHEQSRAVAGNGVIFFCFLFFYSHHKNPIYLGRAFNQ